jgi:hypothetical protein
MATPAASGSAEYERLLTRAASKVAERHIDVYCWYEEREWNSVFGRNLQGFYSQRFNRIDLAPRVCFHIGQALYAGWRPGNYAGRSRLANALLTVAHEAEHAYGIRNEKKAECYGMQHMEWAANNLPLGWRLGRSLAKFYWNNIYPTTRYWSPNCHDGGPWDIYEESIWP